MRQNNNHLAAVNRPPGPLGRFTNALGAAARRFVQPIRNIFANHPTTCAIATGLYAIASIGLASFTFATGVAP